MQYGEFSHFPYGEPGLHSTALGMKNSIPAASLPRAAPVVERTTLLGGVAFIDGVASGWGCWELTGWFEDHLVAPGRMEKSPAEVSEHGFGTIAVDPRRSEVLRKGSTGIEEMPRLLSAARARVVDVLRGFTAPVSDDRFLNAAIYGKRVERKQFGKQVSWVACPSDSDRLSDIVLSLFAADILLHREFHEANLCICEVCGRVSFAPATTTRTGCRQHSQRSNQSGTAFARVDPDELV